MILIDTSIWADHFSRPDSALIAINNEKRSVMHPFVIGELAAGNLHPWARVVAALRSLPVVPSVEEDDFYTFLERQKLMGTGLSLVDIHLLASATRFGMRIWSRDKRLTKAALSLGCCYMPD